MRRLVIAVDCDDVLVKTNPFFIEAYNRTYGTAVTPDHAYTPGGPWGVDQAEITERLALLTQTDEYKALGPEPDEAIILHELAKHHELHLVTARREHEREFTQSMLDRELEGVFTSMEFVGWQGSKGDVCARIGADVLIDDNAHHLHDALAKGLPVGGALVFGEYAWNAAGREHEALKQCSNWAGVKQAIDAIAEADNIASTVAVGEEVA